MLHWRAMQLALQSLTIWFASSVVLMGMATSDPLLGNVHLSISRKTQLGLRMHMAVFRTPMVHTFLPPFVGS